MGGLAISGSGAGRGCHYTWRIVATDARSWGDGRLGPMRAVRGRFLNRRDFWKNLRNGGNAFEFFFLFFFIFIADRKTGKGDDRSRSMLGILGGTMGDLSDQTFWFFCESNFYLRNERCTEDQIAAGKQKENNSENFESNRLNLFYATSQIYRGLLGADRCYGYEKEKWRMIGYYANTKHLYTAKYYTRSYRASLRVWLSGRHSRIRCTQFFWKLVPENLKRSDNELMPPYQASNLEPTLV